MTKEIQYWYWSEEQPKWAECSQGGFETRPIRMPDGELIQVCPLHHALLTVELADLELTAT